MHNVLKTWSTSLLLRSRRAVSSAGDTNRLRILSMWCFLNWLCSPFESGRFRRAIHSGWKSWTKQQIFFDKKANIWCFASMSGWCDWILLGCTSDVHMRNLNPLWFSNPPGSCVIFPGVWALSQGLLRSPSAMFPAWLRLLQASCRLEAKSRRFEFFFLQWGPECATTILICSVVLQTVY